MTVLSRFSLAGKVALVTGAGKGIGQAIAVALAEAGADVCLAGRDAAALGRTAADVAARGVGASIHPFDVADGPSIGDGIATIAGPIDILVNNAGTEQPAPSLDVTEAVWDRILDVNLRGAFFCAQAVARRMREHGSGGAILNICSLTSEAGIPGSAAYGASKSGLAGLTRTLAVEWAPFAIRVNGLGPGYFRTAMTEAFYRDPAWQAAMLSRIPAGRFGALNDLTGAAVFLCSAAAGYITGQVLYADGGTLAAL